MKITDVKTYFVDAVRRNWLFLEVETDSGIVGVGEASSLGLDKPVLGAIDLYRQLLIGQNPLEIEKIWERLIRSRFWRGDLVLMIAFGGIEMALWDIKGKSLGVPVYSLFGGPCRDTVKAYGNYWFLGATPEDYPKTVDDYAKKAAQAVEKGWDALKWDTFGSYAYNLSPYEERVIVEWVKRVREAVGDRADLLLDAHRRFNLATAIRIARRLEEYRPFFIEEPVPPENIDALLEFKRSTRVPVATGEMLSTHYHYRELLSKYATDYIQPDVVYCGGISEIRKIGAMAEACYIPVIAHNGSGPVATAATVHAGATMPNFLMFEYFLVPGRDDVLVEPLQVVNGNFVLPTKPGLGVELNKKVFSKFPYKDKLPDHRSKARDIQL